MFGANQPWRYEITHSGVAFLKEKAGWTVNTK